METTIGKALEGNQNKAIISAFVAAAITICDLVLVSQNAYMTPYRFGFLVIALFAYSKLAVHDSDSLGLTLRPIQGYMYWVWAGILIGIGVLIFIGIALVFQRLLGLSIGPIKGIPFSKAGPFFYYACINAPILEEAVYRLIICVPAAPIAKPIGTILISGSLFAALHFVYGNPSPDNFIAGFFLAWAYLKSGSLLVPIVLHACGNFFVLIFQLAIWYWNN